MSVLRDLAAIARRRHALTALRRVTRTVATDLAQSSAQAPTSPARAAATPTRAA